VKSSWLAALTLAGASILFADGGTLVLRKQTGPLTISIFSSPEPLRVGPADLSVMVQRANDKSEVLDANVKLHLTHAGPEGIAEVFAPATHANAANKLFYAARLDFPVAGVWRLASIVESKNGSAEVAGEVTVRPPQPPILAYWPYFAVVPLIIVLFVVNQWLKKKRQVTRPPTRA